MPKPIPSDHWQPVGVRSLEAAALDTVRGRSNRLVVAGPGAGKTELLAQRACYLLQTGTCPAPRKILAISFKRDAAANLRERVRRRCGEELARRFHSMTFDAFAKGLVDRFHRALPEEYRPAPDYVLDFSIRDRVGDRLTTLAGEASGLTTRDVWTMNNDRLYGRVLLGRALPVPTTHPVSVENRAAAALWHSLLKGGKTSALDFGMLGRLAELVVRSNPLLREAVRRTYSHVFLDEFQDTTRVQYDLTRSLFRGADVVLTAVGDSKQRIMVWAGAVENVFEQFRGDFQADVRDLIMNYRSAPELVRIQEKLIAGIEPGTPTPQPADTGADGRGECRVLLYPDHDREARHLAELAAGWVRRDGVHPRDICVLTRITPAKYVDVLLSELRTLGVKARVETELQDILVEPLTRTLLSALTLATSRRHPGEWASLVALVRELRGLDEDDPRVRTAERELADACRALGGALPAGECSLESLRRNLAGFFGFIGLDRFRRLHPQYLQGTYIKELFKSFTEYLWQRFEATRDWPLALDEVSGQDTIPIITVHKSKGLEYHTVVFMGLEDAAMRNFATQSDEEKRAFFVAFSRAKKRVLFTFCENRAKSGGSKVAQSRKNIGVLYDLLESAGVRAEAVT